MAHVERRAPLPLRALCVAIHDVAPETWPLCARLVAAVRAVAEVPLTLLVVPDYHGRNARVAQAYRRVLDDHVARGDELALHGYHHRDDSPPPVELLDIVRRRFYTAGEGEFAALPEIEARARLVRGREWFRRHGWPLAGFVPPAWLLSPGAARAVRALGFRYTTSLGAFHVLAADVTSQTGSGSTPEVRSASSREKIVPRDITVRAPCLTWSARSGARRRLSLAWNDTLARVAHRASVVRIALHPRDVLHEEIVAQAQRLIVTLASARRPMTKAAFAEAVGEEHVFARRAPRPAEAVASDVGYARSHDRA